MTEKVKDRITQTVLTTVVSIVVFFISFSATNGREDSKELENRVNLKLDKQEFYEYKEIQNEINKTIVEKVTKTELTTATTAVDVAWIKEAMQRKTK